MIRLQDIKHIYFIGIGGIGMSALARYFFSRGVKVSGYDRAATNLTRELEEAGMQVHYDENIDRAPKDVELVVYTPAIPREHKEFKFYLENGYTVVKRSDVLQIISDSSFNICIAGTHGKTTTSTMIAHILRNSGYGCNAFLGGIATNYNTNFWSDERNVCVIEADEYDRSFLKLSPDVAVITSMDADHLDIYGTGEEMEKAFIQFGRKVRTDGVLFSKFGLKRTDDLQASRHILYSLQDEHADIFAVDIAIKNGSYLYSVKQNEWILEGLQLNMGGMHNVENSIVAIAIAHYLGISEEQIKEAISSFKGVKRRFEYILPPGESETVFVDDYAHHPEELKALISGAKNLFGGKKVMVIFQPHLFTRTRDLAQEFAASLDLADEIILLPIYPARELPIEGVSSEMILAGMNNKKKKVFTKEELLKQLAAMEKKDLVLITAGAGDIDQLIEPIKNILLKK